MSITDELRDWVAGAKPAVVDGCSISVGTMTYGCKKALLAIADRIDAEHQKAIRELNNFADASVLLPVDADGVPIRVGDVMKGEKIGGGFSEPFEVIGYIMSNGELEPMDEHKCPRKHVYLHHHQPDSWERIILDAVNVESLAHDVPQVIVDKLVERCRRLADKESE